MSFPMRDAIATAFVAVAGVVYWLWAADSTPAVLDGVRATGLVVLALGIAASVTAVVPGFEELLRGNRLYLAVTSGIGVVALAGGLQMLLESSERGLAIMTGTMGVLWLIATGHHLLLAQGAPRAAPGTTTRLHSVGHRHA